MSPDTFFKIEISTLW